MWHRSHSTVQGYGFRLASRSREWKYFATVRRRCDMFSFPDSGNQHALMDVTPAAVQE